MDLGRLYSLMSKAREGDKEAHKTLTFYEWYSNKDFKDKDPRIFSSDPETIKEYWKDFGVLNGKD